MSSGGNNEDPNRGQEEMNRGKKLAGKRKPSMRPFVQPVVRPRAEESSQGGQSTDSQLQLASSSRSHPTFDTRLTIRSGGNSFIPGNEGGQRVTQAIKSRNYSPSAGSWTLVPDQVKQHYWREFQKLCVWEPEFDGQMYRLFDQKAKHRYNQLMNRLHKRYLARETPPPRLGAISDTRDVWDTLVEYWNTEGFKERSKRASENRRSNPNNTGIAKHRAGSRSIYEHQLNFKETTGEEPDFFDIMQFGHPCNPLTGESTYFRTTEIHDQNKIRTTWSRHVGSSRAKRDSGAWSWESPAQRQPVTMTEASGRRGGVGLVGARSTAMRLRLMSEKVQRQREREKEKGRARKVRSHRRQSPIGGDGPRWRCNVGEDGSGCLGYEVEQPATTAGAGMVEAGTVEAQE